MLRELSQGLLTDTMDTQGQDSYKETAKVSAGNIFPLLYKFHPILDRST